MEIKALIGTSHYLRGHPSTKLHQAAANNDNQINLQPFVKNFLNAKSNASKTMVFPCHDDGIWEKSSIEFGFDSSNETNIKQLSSIRTSELELDQHKYP